MTKKINYQLHETSPSYNLGESRRLDKQAEISGKTREITAFIIFGANQIDSEVKKNAQSDVDIGKEKCSR